MQPSIPDEPDPVADRAPATFWLFLGASTLVLPLAALLFLQWPLRDWVQAGSRLANDIAQIVFAVYVAIAVTAATRAGVHLAAHRPQTTQPVLQGPQDSKDSRWRSIATACCVLPWSLFVLWSGAPVLWQSWLDRERFAETLTPGYYLIKASLGLMALLVALQAIADLRRLRSASASTAAGDPRS